MLREIFSVPDGNPILARWSAQARADPRFQVRTVDGGTEYCLLPLLGAPARHEEEEPVWPQGAFVPDARFAAQLRPRLDGLFQRLAPAGAHGFGPRLGQHVLRAAWRIGLRRHLSNVVVARVAAGLRTQGLLPR